ncbi:MAG: hypothetical protein K6G10_12170 [Butyrivibrio sp.]|nr:hypothetical protein [Butyrivibrio sp.]
MEIKLAIIGDEIGTDEAVKSIKYPEIITEVVIWESEDFYREFDPDSLNGVDIILLAFYYKTPVYEMLKGYLSGTVKISPDHIWDFYRLSEACRPSIRAEKRISLLSPEEKLDGLILGISHAEVGVLEERFAPYNFLNISTSSSDIYSNYKNFELCLEKYRENLSSLKYLVIDMFDYSYFNYDVSMSDNFPGFLMGKGYNKDGHNFGHNQNFNMDFQDLAEGVERRRIKDVSPVSIDIWNIIKSDYKRRQKQSEDFDDPSIMYMIRDAEKTAQFKIGKYAEKEYENTIAENTEIFRKMLELAYKVNQDMQVYLILIPRSPIAFSLEEPMISKWKPRFYSILQDINRDYPFTFIDFVESNPGFSEDLYFDAAHLNIFGAIKFTDILKEKILG